MILKNIIGAIAQLQIYILNSWAIPRGCNARNDVIYRPEVWVRGTWASPYLWVPKGRAPPSPNLPQFCGFKPVPMGSKGWSPTESQPTSILWIRARGMAQL